MVSDEVRNKTFKAENGPHVAVGLIDYPPASGGTGLREKGVLVYIKASMSGDENDYVTAYKAAYHRFPHEPRPINCSAKSNSKFIGHWANTSRDDLLTGMMRLLCFPRIAMNC